MSRFTAGIHPRGIPESTELLEVVQIRRPDGLRCGVGRFTGQFSLGGKSDFDRVRKDYIYWAYGVGDCKVVIRQFTGRNIGQADKIMAEARSFAAKWPDRGEA